MVTEKELGVVEQYLNDKVKEDNETVKAGYEDNNLL